MLSDGTAEYPWYQIVAGAELLQGDLIPSCPLLVPLSPDEPWESTGEERELVGEVLTYDVVVLSQSCDLTNDKLKLALVSPYWPLEEFAEQLEKESGSNDLAGPKGREKLRQGLMPGYHMLKGCELSGLETDFLVVDFRQVYSVPTHLLRDIAAKHARRLRLLPPYREHLAQAFARFLMRVGLPEDIPPFK